MLNVVFFLAQTPIAISWTEKVVKKSEPIFSACSKNLTFSTNLNMAFNEVEGSPFLDFVHLNENGNKIIADQIYEKLLIDQAFK